MRSAGVRNWATSLKCPKEHALMADLNRMLAAVTRVSRPHAFGVIERIRQRLFLIDVLARASSAAQNCSACRCGGVAITTASIEASSRSLR